MAMESAQGWSRKVSIYFCSLRLAVPAPALLRAAGLSWKARAPVRLERRGRKVGVEESGYNLTAWVVAAFLSFPFSPFPCRGGPQANGRVRGVLPETYRGNKTPRQVETSGWRTRGRESSRTRAPRGLSGLERHLGSLLPLRRLRLFCDHNRSV